MHYLSKMKNAITGLFSDWKLRSRRTYVTLAILLVGGGLFFSVSGREEPQAEENHMRQVKVARVSDIMNGGSMLSLVADIRSVSEAKISTESGGRVSRVNASLGNFVSAGQVLAEVENSSQRAALLQAEGALDAAKAAVPNVESSLDAAQSGAVTTLLAAYATFDNAVRDDIDVMFVDPEKSTPTFRVLSSQSQLKTQLENTRPSLSVVIARERAQSASLSAQSDLATELGKTEAELRTLRSYLDMLIQVLNAAIEGNGVSESDIAAYLSNATAARTAVTASLSALSSAKSSLATASNNLGSSGNGPSAAGAALKQAQGAYNSALASLEKTIIRTPISGTLNNFTVKLGDYLSPTQQVAIVSNNGALEGVVYVTEEDRARVGVGAQVTFESGVVGTITRIAPALDPVTRRIEVRIGLPANATSLSNGQSVRVQLGTRTTPKPVTGPLSIPITALKIEANRTIVFVVESGILAAKEIHIGKLSGSAVQVTDGLTPEMTIVVDARGLKEGDEVEVAE
jgi:multidrug efflux pump subunit AcrA (membrane-fusion protein)